VTKRRVGRYPKAFRQMAVERLNQCENIVELARNSLSNDYKFATPTTLPVKSAA